MVILTVECIAMNLIYCLFNILQVIFVVIFTVECSAKNLLLLSL
jgi:hypothetical protein